MDIWKKISLSQGKPSPLGANSVEKGVNFAFFSTHSTALILGLFMQGETKPFREISLDPKQNRTGNIWHIQIDFLPEECYYAYRINKDWILDPYAKDLNSPTTWGEKRDILLGKVFPDLNFDWKEDKPIQLPQENLFIYEMHVRGYTIEKNSETAHPGTFLGIIEKIPYLQELGITAVELLPIYEFDETANPNKNPKRDETLFNYWGYTTLNFFTPMRRYGSIQDFKTMVQALHTAGIEVILDVVYNHVDLRMFHPSDKEVYYILNENGEHTNFTGCGNTTNCNEPVMSNLILSSLRYWVSEMHVDGFRFDLASIFCRDENGKVLSDPPVIRTIIGDPVLANTRLIAEVWDCGGLYQLGSFPGSGRFAEWNGDYRDTVRRFIKSTEGQGSPFASVMSGSQYLFGNQSPLLSINFITAHDGFTLRDLVSYNEKHNKENGEQNKDGNSFNISWNCGAEGPTNDARINTLRQKQIRNFLCALCLSIGTPMLLMGDEYGHTRNGNNNSYCHDNKKNHFLWKELQKNQPLFQLTKKLISLRKSFSQLRKNVFLNEEDVTWHGMQPQQPNWSYDNRFIAYTLKGQETDPDLYVAFNAYLNPIDIHLPPPDKGEKWKLLIDTSTEDTREKELDNKYRLNANSTLILKT